MVAFAQELEALYPLSVADYMARCNAHYYATRDPLGAAGDFTTAPEISQIFGEVIAALIAHLWDVQGRTDFTLIEGGPGRGTLMADMLRTLSSVPGCLDGADVALVEASPSLREKQKDLLKTFSVPIMWYDNISDIELINKNNILIFNELFDAFPSAQYVWQSDGWHERLVDKPGYKLGAKTDLAVSYPAKDGDILEQSPARTALMADIAARVRDAGGMAVIVDYGTGDWGVGDTLQALRHHKPVDPLTDPGEADLTTHVDFGALADVAREVGLYVHPLMTQGAFLSRLGGAVRAEKLGKQADYARLVAPDQMGSLFKVLVVSHIEWASALREVLP